MQPEDWPQFNAVLNGVSAVLLGAGYAAVRRGRVTLHISCMLTALGVSALFLSSYLYYHIVVRQGQHTSFGGSPEAYAVYLAVLLSHTVLAVAAAPLALFTAYQGLRGNIPRHVRVARWTLPIWLYVSITGVVVYLMLIDYYK